MGLRTTTAEVSAYGILYIVKTGVRQAPAVDTQNHPTRRLDTGVLVHRADHGFDRIGQYGIAAVAPALEFSGTQIQPITDSGFPRPALTSISTAYASTPNTAPECTLDNDITNHWINKQGGRINHGPTYAQALRRVKDLEEQPLKGKHPH